MTTTAPNRALHFEALEGHVFLEDALAVLDAAARWLAEQGIDQWPDNFTESAPRARWLAEQADQGNVFVGYMLNRPMSTVTVTDWQDPDFASGWAPGGSARYVCRLAATVTGRRLYPGLGGRTLLYARRVAEAQGADALRLDCSKTNTRLHEYYRAQGFHYVGEVDVAGRRSGALFQLDLR